MKPRDLRYMSCAGTRPLGRAHDRRTVAEAALSERIRQLKRGEDPGGRSARR